MPLTEQKTHHESVKLVALAAGVIGIVWAITRSTLPQVGDNVHKLPHGGQYQDGTKVIRYNSPGCSSHSAKSSSGFAFLVVVIIGLYLAADAWFRSSSSRSVCVVCRDTSCAASGGRVSGHPNRRESDYSQL
nr:MAG: putative triple gene block protein 2 [Sichuan alphaflexivirus 1]